MLKCPFIRLRDFLLPIAMFDYWKVFSGESSLRSRPSSPIHWSISSRVTCVRIFVTWIMWLVLSTPKRKILQTRTTSIWCFFNWGIPKPMSFDTKISLFYCDFWGAPTLRNYHMMAIIISNGTGWSVEYSWNHQSRYECARCFLVDFNTNLSNQGSNSLEPNVELWCYQCGCCSWMYSSWWMMKVDG